MRNDAPLLEATGLVKHLGGRRVVDGVDLTCRAGQVLGLLGPNGAGKTTTLRMLYGFLRTDAGVIRMDGRDVSGDIAPFKRALGATTQVELRHVIWGEVLWAAVLTTMYFTIVSIVLVLCRLGGLVDIDITMLPLLLPLAFIGACAFGALGLCFTALVPSIDHMNVPLFLLVLPMAMVSGTYFPMQHPWLAVVSVPNPLYHLAETNRALLLHGPVAGHLTAALGIFIVMIGVLVPLNLRLLRRRVLGED